MRNISWLAVANVLVKPLWLLFITAICMRVLGVTGYGVFATALALAFMLATLSGLGTSQYVIREIAKTPRLAAVYFSNLLLSRILLTWIIIAMTIGVGILLNYNSNLLYTLVIAAVFAAITQLMDLCRAFYRAFEVLRYEAISIVTERLLVVLIGTVFLLVLRSPQGVIMGMTLGLALAFAANLWWVHYRLAALSTSELSLKLLRKAYLTALPLGLFGFFADLYVRNGPVLLEALVSETEAGIYSAAARMIEALLLLPAVVVSSFLPRFSVLLHEGRLSSQRALFRRGLLGTAIASVVVAVAITLLGPWLMNLLDPSQAFIRSGRMLQLLVWAFPLMAVNFILSAALFAVDQQKYLAILCGIAVIFSFGLNFLLIPSFQAYGAIAALFATEVFVCVGLSTRYRSIQAS